MIGVNSKFYGLSQFKGPFCYELSGKNFHLVMDDGKEFSLYFLDGENLQWAYKGEAYKWETYECMKGDDTTYFVWFQPACAEIKTTWCFILDTEQSLVTYVTIEEGKVPECPRVMTIMPYFGAIKLPGRSLPEKRHHMSDRMVGHGIYWFYNPGKSLQHLYRTPTNIRASSGPGITPVAYYKDLMENATNEEDRQRFEDLVNVFIERAKTYPFYDEPCFHIWIKDNLNLFAFVEENQIYYTKKDGGGGIVLLQEVDRLTDIGLSFNTNEYYMVGAYGREEERHDPLMDAETPFDWSQIRSPWIHWPVEHDE